MVSSRFPHRIDPEDIRVGDKISVQSGDIERIGVVGRITFGSRGRCFWAAEQLISLVFPEYTFTLLDRPAPPLPTTPGALIRITADASGVLSEPAYAMLRYSEKYDIAHPIWVGTKSFFSREPSYVSENYTWELVYEPGADRIDDNSLALLIPAAAQRTEFIKACQALARVGATASMLQAAAQDIASGAYKPGVGS